MFAAPEASAAVIAEYTFGTSSVSLASSDTDPDATSSTASNISDSFAGAGTTTGGNPGPVFQWNGTNVTNNSPTTQYLEFTITPASGMQVTYGTISLDMQVQDASSTVGGYSFTVRARASTTNFATEPAEIDFASSPSVAGPPTTSAYATDTIDLTSLGTIAVPVTIRLGINETSGSNQKFGRIDNIRLDAAVTPVPEPLTGLAAAALISLSGRRRRRRH